MRDFPDYCPHQLDALLAPGLEHPSLEPATAAQAKAEKTDQLIAISELLRDRSRVLLEFSDDVKQRGHIHRTESRALSQSGLIRR
jgi:hypothetical protein